MSIGVFRGHVHDLKYFVFFLDYWVGLEVESPGSLASSFSANLGFISFISINLAITSILYCHNIKLLSREPVGDFCCNEKVLFSQLFN